MAPVPPEMQHSQQLSNHASPSGEPSSIDKNTDPLSQFAPGQPGFIPATTPMPQPGENPFPQSRAYTRQMDEFALQSQTASPGLKPPAAPWALGQASPFGNQVGNPFNPGTKSLSQPNPASRVEASRQTTGTNINSPVTPSRPIATEPRRLYEIPAGQFIANGYRDDGRIQPPGQHDSPPRETIIVNRNRDTVLRFTIADVINRFSHLPEEHRAIAMSKYVADIFSRAGNDRQIADITNQFPQRDMPLGEIINTGAGVSRHRALLYKILADEVGLKTAMVSGQYRDSNGQITTHNWNMITLGNGQQMLVDPTHRRHVPVTDPWVKRYLDFENRPFFR